MRQITNHSFAYMTVNILPKQTSIIPIQDNKLGISPQINQPNNPLEITLMYNKDDTILAGA